MRRHTVQCTLPLAWTPFRIHRLHLRYEPTWYSLVTIFLATLVPSGIYISTDSSSNARPLTAEAQLKQDLILKFLSNYPGLPLYYVLEDDLRIRESKSDVPVSRSLLERKTSDVRPSAPRVYGHESRGVWIWSVDADWKLDVSGISTLTIGRIVEAADRQADSTSTRDSASKTAATLGLLPLIARNYDILTRTLASLKDDARDGTSAFGTTTMLIRARSQRPSLTWKRPSSSLHSARILLVGLSAGYPISNLRLKIVRDGFPNRTAVQCFLIEVYCLEI
ncbi:hypothetical protein FRC08_001386 [Ceratobasidium sp. 394]|nr:hypothetical protein FRC08_001386 [Ceratobasidium sp. 394]